MRKVVAKLLKLFFIQDIRFFAAGSPGHSEAMLAYSPYVRPTTHLGVARYNLAALYSGTLGTMKRPTLRVTKWLADIPIEGCCSLCPETLFHAASPHHRPQKVEYTERLQGEFDRHVADSHGEETPV